MCIFWSKFRFFFIILGHLGNETFWGHFLTVCFSCNKFKQKNNSMPKAHSQILIIQLFFQRKCKSKQIVPHGLLSKQGRSPAKLDFHFLLTLAAQTNKANSRQHWNSCKKKWERHTFMSALKLVFVWRKTEIANSFIPQIAIFFNSCLVEFHVFGTCRSFGLVICNSKILKNQVKNGYSKKKNPWHSV